MGISDTGSGITNVASSAVDVYEEHVDFEGEIDAL